jgi:hypothetical protein
MDELFGDIKDLSDSLSRLSLLPPDFEGKEKVKIEIGFNLIS